MEFSKFKERVFQLADMEGFDEYEIYYANGESFKVSVYENEIDSYSVNSNAGLSFRGIFEGRMGYAYTEILDEASAVLLVRSAKDNASVIENEDKEIIYGGKDIYSGVEGYNPGLTEIGPDQKIRLALEMERLAKERDNRVKSVRHCSVNTFEEKITIVNSKGLDLSHSVNGVYAVLIPVIKDGEKMNTAVAYKISNRFDEMDASEIAGEAVENALAYIGAGTVESGKYRIVLRNDVAGDLLEAFSGIFSADRVQKGLSLLKGNVGKPIASSAVTIIDDPLLKDGMSSAPFDAEGVAAYTKEVVKDGMLLTFLYNLKTAMKDGIRTTGNASKASYASTVDISPSNFYIKPGDKPLEQMLLLLEGGLFITELQGLHSGANSVSGDFSLAAKGFLVKGGRVEKPVEQFTIAGNFFTLLKDIEAVGSDLKFGMPSGGGCFGSPAILLKELSVAGK